MECRLNTDDFQSENRQSDNLKERRLQKLLGNPHIWRPGSTPVRQGDTLPSGFPDLDVLLGGGWPPGILTELLLDGQGIGELRLLMPALKALQLSGARGQKRSQSCWVAPPFIPYAPALARHGLDLSRLFIVSPETPRDALWAMEQALRSYACAIVLCWVDQPDSRAVRRLQVAAEGSGARGFLLRPARFAGQPSTAPLRIRLSGGAAARGLQLELLRNRYGKPGSVSLAC